MQNQVFILAIFVPLAGAARGDDPVTLTGLNGWVGAVAFTPDGRKLAVGTGDGGVSIWDLKRGTKVDATPGLRAVSALAFTPDGTTLIRGAHSPVLAIMRLNRDQTKIEGTAFLPGVGGPLLALALSPDGKTVYAGDFKGTIAQYEIADHRFVNSKAVHASWVNGLAIDRSGEMLASAGSDNTVRLSRPKTLDEIHTFRVKEGEVRAVAISPDRKLVAAGIRYGGVRVWDVDTKKEVASLKAHVGETWAVAFTPDGKMLASGGGDWNKPGEVRLWDAGTWKERATLKHTGEVLCLTVSPDGRALAAGSWDRTVKIWDLTRVSPK